jgi:hypothetical protein
MPTNRKWLMRKSTALRPSEISFLADNDEAVEAMELNLLEANFLETLRWGEPAEILFNGRPGPLPLIREFGEGFLAEYVEQYPGYRPSWWWRYSDPPRRRVRVGGIGEPWPGVCGRDFYMGVPASWSAKPRHPLHPNDPQPVDLNNPPIYESQPSFLDRAGLLSDAERAQLTDEDYEPLSVTEGWGEE